ITSERARVATRPYGRWCASSSLAARSPCSISARPANMPKTCARLACRQCRFPHATSRCISGCASSRREKPLRHPDTALEVGETGTVVCASGKARAGDGPLAIRRPGALARQPQACCRRRRGTEGTGDAEFLALLLPDAVTMLHADVEPPPNTRQ